jgi:hypothetical protein
VRSGSTITGSYYSSGHWVPIHSARENTPADANIKLVAYTNRDLFANKQVKIAFDNFALNDGQSVNCQPSVSATTAGAAGAANQTGAMANKTTSAATTTAGAAGAANQTENKKVDSSVGVEEFFRGLLGVK